MATKKTNDTPDLFERVIDPRDARRIAAFEARLEKRIDEGVAYLDKRFGKTKWLQRVNENVLDIQKGKVCITGQLFGDFWEGWITGEKMTEAKARKYGFLLHEGENQIEFKHGTKGEGLYIKHYIDGYNTLTNLWYCRIRSLRKVRNVAYTGK